jgi:quaternary ammonium compound-resistance protein SugE
MSWLFLLFAGLLEIGWPVGLKIAQMPGMRWTGVFIAAGFILASGFFLWLAQKEIPIGTTYAIWAGIGTVGTFLVGTMMFGDPTSLGRFLGVALILGGVAMLKLAH